MRRSTRIVRLAALGGALAGLGASQSSFAQTCHYRLEDVGTLGGTTSVIYDVDDVNFTPAPFNGRGQLALTSLTSAGYAAAAEWSHGALIALPNLPNANVGGGGSNATGINERGVVVGAADDGVINPLNQAPYDHAVLWSAGQIERLPELDGHASWANFVTDDGVVIGYANNGVRDPYTYAGTQTRAAIWEGGVLRELGTLGGTDSAAFAARRGERASGHRLMVIGTSSLDTAAGPPFGIPQTDAFLWSGGVMTDLGTLGGLFSVPMAVNGRGQVAVVSFDATNQHFQTFLWKDGQRTLLRALGGHFVEAVALDDRGDSVGAVSDAADQNAVAAVWGPSGEGEVLGTVAGDTGSIALGINSCGVVVGGSGKVSFAAAAAYAHAFVRGPGGAVQDLNTLVAPGATLTLNVAYAVNDKGEIAGLGTNAAGETHAFVLRPDDCDERAGFESASRAPAAPGSVVRTRALGRIGNLARAAGLRR